MSTAVLDQSMQLSPPAPPLYEPKAHAALNDDTDSNNSPSQSPASFASSFTASSASSPPPAPSPAVAAVVDAAVAGGDDVIDLTAEADDVAEEERAMWRQRKRRKRAILMDEEDDDDADGVEDGDGDEDQDDEEEDEDEEDEEDEDEEEQDDVEYEGEEEEEERNDESKQEARPELAERDLEASRLRRRLQRLAQPPAQPPGVQRMAQHADSGQQGYRPIEVSDEMGGLIQDMEQVADIDMQPQQGLSYSPALAPPRRRHRVLFSPPPSGPQPAPAPAPPPVPEPPAAFDPSAPASSSSPSPSPALSLSASSSSASAASAAASPAVLDRLYAASHPQQMQFLVGMGYPRGQAAAALRLAEGDEFVALRWLPPAVPLAPRASSSSGSSNAPAGAAASLMPASSPAPPADPVSSTLSAAQLSRLRNSSSHSAIAMPADVAAFPASAAPSFQHSHSRYIPSPSSAPAPFPPAQFNAARVLQHSNAQPLQPSASDHRHAAAYPAPLPQHYRYGPLRPSDPQPPSSFMIDPHTHVASPADTRPFAMSASSYPPGAVPLGLAAPLARPAPIAAGRSRRFAAPPASPSPSASQSSPASLSAFFPYQGAELGDRVGDSELRQHLMDTLMSYGMAAPHSSGGSSSSASSHRRSRHSRSQAHSHPHLHSSALSAAAMPVDPFDPTGLIAANDTSTLPKELPAALTSLLAYIATIAPSLASTQQARLQSITYHLQSLASASVSVPASAAAAADASSSEALTKGETAGEGAGEGEGGAVCPVCWDSACDALLLPCRHLSCCGRCAGDMKERQLQCPRCNERIRHVLVVRP